MEQARAAEAEDHLGAPFAATAKERWIIGTPEEAASKLRAFAATHGVDEVMVSPVAGSTDDEPMDAATGRIQTLELLAAALA
ncbi:MAG: hypothetical protein E2584_04415 [Microbacterium sp.]|nr:hypothetical protein [Microbacterium sp.]